MQEFVFGVNAETNAMTINGLEFDEFVEDLSENIKKADPILAAVALWGFEFYFRGKPLRRL